MAEYDYDLFVIGAGSGGVRAARMAAMSGAKVAVAEEYRVGGTCVVRGCVPKKLMVYASAFTRDFELARTYGWQFETPKFDWPTFLQNKDQEISPRPAPTCFTARRVFSIRTPWRSKVRKGRKKSRLQRF